MRETTDKPLDRTEIWLCRMATLLVFISFGAFLLNSAAVPAFTGHITRLATKFVF